MRVLDGVFAPMHANDSFAFAGVISFPIDVGERFRRTPSPHTRYVRYDFPSIGSSHGGAELDAHESHFISLTRVDSPNFLVGNQPNDREGDCGKEDRHEKVLEAPSGRSFSEEQNKRTDFSSMRRGNDRLHRLIIRSLEPRVR
jgi:hypothetical protein